MAKFVEMKTKAISICNQRLSGYLYLSDRIEKHRLRIYVSDMERFVDFEKSKNKWSDDILRLCGSEHSHIDSMVAIASLLKCAKKYEWVWVVVNEKVEELDKCQNVISSIEWQCVFSYKIVTLLFIYLFVCIY